MFRLSRRSLLAALLLLGLPVAGQALDVGRRGDADVVFVHDRVAEERFVAEGFGGPRRHVMFNDEAIAAGTFTAARAAMRRARLAVLEAG